MSIVDNCIPCMHTKENLPKPIDPSIIIRGTKNQYMMSGKYAGNQCTSICIAALAWFHGKGKRGHFTPEAIDTALYTGTELHRYLREVEESSKDNDLRVALDDLPQTINIGDVQLVRNKEEERFTVLYQPNEGFAGFLLFGDLLRQYAIAPFGILITTGPYSQAVFYTCNGRWAVFDSHGYLTYKCRLPRHQASVWEFDSIEAVVGFLVEVRRGEVEVQVHKPTVIPLIQEPEIEIPMRPSLITEGEPDLRKETGNPEFSPDFDSEHTDNTTEVVSPTQIDVIPVVDEEDEMDDTIENPESSPNIDSGNTDNMTEGVSPTQIDVIPLDDKEGEEEEEEEDENPFVCLMGGF